LEIYFAPILGITNFHYRNSFYNLFGGVDKYFMPFVSTVSAEKINVTLLKDLIPAKNNASILIPQILGNNGADFKRMSKAIIELGYSEVNWNIGCPFPTVAGKSKGAGILPHTDKIREFLDIVMNNQICPLTVKMRLGMNSPDEFIKVLEIINDYPVKELIIHGRTGKQYYTGSIQLEYVKEFFNMSKIPCVYNGDVFEYSDYEKIKELAGNKIMLGRGLISNPFLAMEIKGDKIEQSEKVKLIKRFHDELYISYQNYLYGGKHLLDKMKGIWIYLSSHLCESEELLKKIKRSKTIDNYNIIISQYFGSNPEWEEKGIYYFMG
jgi:tRNA-dihydrouridine synthase B